ncbi:MAG TPA: GntR family transcriptional regulator [Spirochaetia bacterium]|nr:GntR family transcriptional regulator [Spirochaetia bacterium]
MRSSNQSGRSGPGAVTDGVYARLREAIVSAELRPNGRLVESELAVRLDVSRTPVREALLRLEQEGFVRRERGWVVRENEPEEVRSRLECRVAIEGYAARLASQRRDEARLASLRGLAEAMLAGEREPGRMHALNDSFHGLILEASGNATLALLHAQTKMNYWDLSVPVVFTPDDDRLVDEQHAALLAAIADRDADEAERVARAHVQRTLDIVLGELKARYRGFSA